MLFRSLADPIAAALRAYADRGASDILGTHTAAATFRAAVLRSHTTFIALVDRRGGQAETVYLELRPFVLNLADQVGVGALARQELPPTAGELHVIDESNVSTIRSWIDLTRTASVWLYAASIGLYVAAFALTRDRRRLLAWAGSGLVAVGIALFIARAIGRTVVLDQLLPAGSPYRAATGQAYAIFTALVPSLAWPTLATGIATVGIAWLAGPGIGAHWGRAFLAPLLVRRPLIGWIALATAGIVSLVIAPLSDPTRIVPRLAVGAVFVIGYELIRRRTALEHPGGGWTLADARARLQHPPGSTNVLAHAHALHRQGLLSDEQFVAIARQSAEE